MSCPSLTDLPAPPPRTTGWPWTEESPQLPDTMPDGSPWPRVSIVTPSYNQGQFIEETIRSVLLQGYPNLEYLIIDGGSTDESVEIIRRYEPWLTYWVSEPDEGQADAINKGWQRATGDFLGWINSDDLLTPGSIGTAVRYLQERPHIGLVFGDLQHIDAQGQPLGLRTFQEFDLVEIVKNSHSISQPGNLFRRSVFQRVGLLDASLHFMMDFDYWLRAALVCQIGYLPRALARFRRHEGAKTTRKMDVAAHDVVAVYRKFFGRADLPAELVEIRHRAWASAHLQAATAWFAASDLANARAQLRAALGSDAGMMMQSRFWRVLLPILFATLGGGRDSHLYHLARAVWRKANSRRNLSMRAQR